jgi:hypothetical protein
MSKNEKIAVAKYKTDMITGNLNLIPSKVVIRASKNDRLFGVVGYGTNRFGKTGRFCHAIQVHPDRKPANMGWGLCADDENVDEMVKRVNSAVQIDSSGSLKIETPDRYR